MLRRISWIVAATVVLAAMTVSGVAIATAPTGSVVSEVIGAGSMDRGVGFAATPGTNTIVADFTFGPNSSTGWHSHPGKTLVTVKSGTFTVYHARNCHPHVYGPGDAFVERPSSVHVGRNETTGVVELGVVFFGVPIGASPRIDRPQPAGCDVT
jgi:quercetin dioxygenase-like cupin family protein